MTRDQPTSVIIRNMIAESLKEFAHLYPNSKAKSFAHDDVTRLITETVPSQLRAKLNISTEEYLVKGSVGQGRWAEIPWIAIMHRGVTTSTQNGFYNVMLLSKDLDRAYICVGLGWTQFAERYGNKQGREVAGLYAKKLVDYLAPDAEDEVGEIDLGATASLGKGYELSNILSTKVIIDDLDDDQLVQILRRHLAYYRQLRETLGADLFYGDELIKRPVSETEERAKRKVKELSTTVNKAKALRELQSIADTLPPAKRKVYVSQIVRNKAFADFVKERASFVCEICGRKPFAKKGGQPYAEADHVDPLYGSGVDHPDNMRCLCAQCHRVVTYGSEDEILKLTQISKT